MQLFVFTILLFENAIASRLSKFSVDETQTVPKLHIHTVAKIAIPN